MTSRAGLSGNPEKDASPGGSLVLPDSDGIVNWQPPTYDPQTGLFYVATDEEYSVFYRTEPNVKALQGLNGIQEQRVGSDGEIYNRDRLQDGQDRVEASAGFCRRRQQQYRLDHHRGKIACSAAMLTATWWLTTLRTESRSGIPTSEGYRMQWKPTCLMGANIFWRPQAILSMLSL